MGVKLEKLPSEISKILDELDKLKIRYRLVSIDFTSYNFLKSKKDKKCFWSKKYDFDKDFFFQPPISQSKRITRSKGWLRIFQKSILPFELEFQNPINEVWFKIKYQ